MDYVEILVNGSRVATLIDGPAGVYSYNLNTSLYQNGPLTMRAMKQLAYEKMGLLS